MLLLVSEQYIDSVIHGATIKRLIYFYFAAGNYLITTVKRPEMLRRGSEIFSVLCVMYLIVDCGLIWINPLYWQFIVLVTKHEKYTYGD